ncbi:MAG: RNA polymerase sigma factor [Planctomycetota bacterium]|jgi:RNA polymerase sigma-70 factor (ECF subfamily)
MTRASPKADDGTLLTAFREGRVEAFEVIVRRHYPGLLRVAEQRCGAGALAEDAVQLALVRAHRYLSGEGASIDNLGAWLRRIVYNCATDLLKSERKDRPDLDLAAVVAAPPDETLERHEIRQLVIEAIERLPEIYREPLTLCYLHGIEAREIAAQLRDNLHSIKSRIARGRRELRRRLEGVLTKAGYLQP